MYEIGQIIYVLSDKTHKIIPVKVVEQITRKSLVKDSIIEYFVISNNDDLDKGFFSKLESNKTDCFTSLDEARNYLLCKASEAIDKVIFDAQISEQSNLSNQRDVQSNQ